MDSGIFWYLLHVTTSTFSEGIFLDMKGRLSKEKLGAMISLPIVAELYVACMIQAILGLYVRKHSSPPHTTTAKITTKLQNNYHPESSESRIVWQSDNQGIKEIAFTQMGRRGGDAQTPRCGDSESVSYTHLTLPTRRDSCRSRWSPYH